MLRDGHVMGRVSLKSLLEETNERRHEPMLDRRV